ncbi:MAG: hypothetical protein B9S34_05955 [Opitutia bacterium Tous-C1TDCM]|nr:MAG: hypothetical protein B9S34_05955 [Opitutae bacterium Tous-C1TDCM]
MKNVSGLAATAQALVAPGKGILAADESFPTIGKRFAALGVAATAENRRAYREVLFRTAALGESISGAILFDETLRQRTGSGDATLTELLVRQGIIPGIKVDTGTGPLPGSPHEKITGGLEALPVRLTAYAALGARFTKWRAVLAITPDGQPSRACLDANAAALADFAAFSQAAGLVPIVEPEVLLAGRHSLARSEDVAVAVLDAVFRALAAKQVSLPGLLLKTGMVLPGAEAPGSVTTADIAAATWRVLRRTVPAAVPGIVFLSGGQPEIAATERLNALCATHDLPWTLSFSFGRALQDTALKTWRGEAANTAAAQAALLHRARCNALAVQGKYSAAAESAAA